MKKPGKLTLAVMAAGIGSRYGGLKQIEPIGPGGETALDYAVHDALRAGFGKVVFIVRREMHDLFRDRIGRRIEERVETDYVRQELDDLPDGVVVPVGRAKPWGTGHAVLCCADVVEEPFGVINADDFYGPASYVALARFLRQTPNSLPNSQSPIRNPQFPLSFCLIAFELGKTLSPHGAVARGVCEADADGFLKNIRERTKVVRTDAGIADQAGDPPEPLDMRALVSTNMWGFTPGLFPRLADAFLAFLQGRGSDPKAEFFLPDAVGGMIAEGIARVKVIRSAEQWFGMTYRADRPCVEQRIRALMERGAYPPELWAD